MAKWADYLISAVRYQEVKMKKFISQVKVHTDNGDSISSSTIWSRQTVIDYLDKGYSFITIYKGQDSGWKKGEDVGKVKINNNFYLKTDANNKEEDNLENLPEF